MIGEGGEGPKDRIVNLPRGDQRARQLEGESVTQYGERLARAVVFANQRVRYLKENVDDWTIELEKARQELMRLSEVLPTGATSLTLPQREANLQHWRQTIKEREEKLARFKRELGPAEAELVRCEQHLAAFRRQRELARKDAGGPTSESS